MRNTLFHQTISLLLVWVLCCLGGSTAAFEDINEGSIGNRLDVTLVNPSLKFPIPGVVVRLFTSSPYIDYDSLFVIGDIPAAGSARALFDFDVLPNSAGNTGVFFISVGSASGDRWSSSDNIPGLRVDFRIINDNTTMAYVIDRSGSMTGSPLANAKAAAQMSIASLHLGDQLAVVSFTAGATTNFSRQFVRDDSVRQQAQQAVENLTAGGQTCIGAGLMAAYNQLKDATSTTKDYMLLTDGIDSPGFCSFNLDAVVALFQNSSSPLAVHRIHSLGFGGGSDQQGLARASALTGGRYLFLPNTTDRMETMRAFNSLHDHIAGNEAGQRIDSSLTLPEEHAHSFEITSSITQQTIKLYWDHQEDTLSLSLERPDGAIIDSSNWQSFDGVDRVTGPAVEYYAVDDPDNGGWIAHIRGQKVDSTSVYSLSFSALSTLQMQLSFGKNFYAVEDSVLLLATLSEDSLPLTGASVEARIEFPSAALGAYLSQRYARRQAGDSPEDDAGDPPPDGQSSMIPDAMTLFDDGAHGDGAAGDGVYGNYYTNTATLGSYNFSVTAGGTSPGSGPYLRNGAISTYLQERPQIALRTAEIDFGDVIVNTGEEQIFFLENSAVFTAGTLEISGISSSDSAFVATKTFFSVSAARTDAVPVLFTPTAADSFSTTLTVHSNDLDDPAVTLIARGRGISPPALAANLDTLSAQLAVGDSLTSTLSIANTGGSDLVWDLLYHLPAATLAPGSNPPAPGSSIPDDDIAAIIAASTVNNVPPAYRFNNQINRPPSHRPELMSFNFEEIGEQFSDNLAPPQTATSAFASNRGATLFFAQGGEDSSGALFGDVANSENVFLDTHWSTNLTGDWAVSFWVNAMPSTIFPHYLWGDASLPGSASDFRCFLGFVAGVGNLIVRGPFADVVISGVAPGPSKVDIVYDGSVPEIRAYLNGALNNVVPQSQPISIVGQGGPFKIGGFDDEPGLPFQMAFDSFKLYNRVSANVPWINTAAFRDTIAAGGSLDIPLTLSAAALLGGDYQANLRLISNDPQAPDRLIPVRLQVTGTPLLAVSPDSVDFGAVITGTMTAQSMVLSNAGTDLLTVTSIVSDNPVFSPSLSGFSLTPGEDTTLVVSFSPDSIAPFSGALSITSNESASPRTVALTGSGIPAPVISVQPAALSDTLLRGESAARPLVISNPGGSLLDFRITADIPDSSVLNPLAGGQAGFNYGWIDSDAPGGPAFNWIDISATGAESGIDEDGGSAVVPIGFDFVFYGQNYNQVMIADDGYISFTDYGESEWVNTTIPSTDLPDNFIAPYWTDFDGDEEEPIYYETRGSAPNRQFIVQFEARSLWSNSNQQTFQIILNEADAGIVMQYLTIDPDSSSNEVTVGIENQDGTDGLQIAYNEFYAHDSLAVAISLALPLISASPDSGMIAPGDSMVISAIFNAVVPAEGDYSATFLIDSNDPATPQAAVAVSLTVLPNPEIELSATALDFGAVRLGTSAARNLRISNSERSDLLVNIASSHGDFAATPAAFTVPGFSSLDVAVTFTPTLRSIRSESLQVASNDVDEPLLTVALTGSGFAPGAPRNLTAIGADSSVDLAWSPPILSDLAVLKYDDGTPEGSFSLGSTLSGDLAVRFTPAAYPVTVLGFDVWFDSDDGTGMSQGSFSVMSGDSLSGPGSVLASGTNTIQRGFFQPVDLGADSVTLSAGDFFITFHEPLSSTLQLAWDTNSAGSGRSWIEAPGLGIAWQPLADLGSIYDNNLMVRAVIRPGGSTRPLTLHPAGSGKKHSAKPQRQTGRISQALTTRENALLRANTRKTGPSSTGALFLDGGAAAGKGTTLTPSAARPLNTKPPQERLLFQNPPSWLNLTALSGFRLYRSPDGINFTEAATLDSNALAYTDSPLNPNNAYWYYLTALQGSSESASSDTVMTVVGSLNEAPQALNDLITLKEDFLISARVLVNDSDPEGAPLAISAVIIDSNNGSAAIEPGDTTIAYTPPADSSGSFQFQYVVTDGLDADTATVLLTVTPVNDPPDISGVPDLTVSTGNSVQLDLNPFFSDRDNAHSEIYLVPFVGDSLLVTPNKLGRNIPSGPQIAARRQKKSAAKLPDGKTVLVPGGSPQLGLTPDDLIVTIDSLTNIATFSSTADSSGELRVFIMAFDPDLAMGVDTLQVSIDANCTPGWLGNVTTPDTLANSTDALVILSKDVGLPVPPASDSLIALGFGNTNAATGDTATNSTDALIVLSFDAGLPVPFPVGQPACLTPTASPEMAGPQTVAFTPPGENDRITVMMEQPDNNLPTGSVVDVAVRLDLSRVSEKVGSYTAKLQWDARLLQYLGYQGGSTAGFEQPVVNPNRSEVGELTFAAAAPQGGEGRVHLLTARFRVVGRLAVGEPVSLNIRTLAAAATFRNLLPYLFGGPAPLANASTAIPGQYEISNYPNPFNPVTHIRFGLPRAGRTRIVVFNTLGQRVAVLLDRIQPAGYYEIDFDGQYLPSGLYFYRIQSGDFTRTVKMILLK